MRQALVNARLLLDDGFVDGHAVLVEGERIATVVPDDDRRVRAADVRHDLAGLTLLPGFIDTQVNGGGGVLFNDAPSVDTIRRIGAAHRRYGTTGFLPTLISDDLDVVARGIAATDAANAAGVPGVVGIHIEGPFLNSARRGTHDPSKLRSLDASAFQLLTSLRHGRTLVTLAPEVASAGMIRMLVEAGVIVAAGHTNATYRQIAGALAEGLRGFTHLFNAMSQLTVREPGVVGAALEDRGTWCGIIVDGRHVNAVALRLALRCKPIDRFMLVTDAMPTVGADAKSFNLQGKPISVEDGVCVDELGVLSGSDLDMSAAVRNAIAQLDVDLATAARMASLHPAMFLGLGHELGRIAPGYRANLVAVDAAVHVAHTWIDGIGS
ncbi:MAG TPA: N-acetylglucosamine-6-phosphate deacetylase [Steroidobacteraceae bacterium]|nr:N-acetylglucosamine-6-phosphate deacetylase [Steroidobacteraceae bacterium]